MTDPDVPEPGPTPAPSGLPLGEAVDASGGDGGQFQAVEGGEIRCLTCRRTSDAAEQQADEPHRVEGASDPADEAFVTRVVCPHCGTAGVLVLRYGAEASEADADVLVRLGRADAGAGAPVGTTEGGGTGPHGFAPAGPGTLADQRDLVDEQGDDIREYTGEPVETDEGWVLPQQQNVGPGNEAVGGETDDPAALPTAPRDDVDVERPPRPHR